jgi:hypothetical protein
MAAVRELKNIFRQKLTAGGKNLRFYLPFLPVDNPGRIIPLSVHDFNTAPRFEPGTRSRVIILGEQENSPEVLSMAQVNIQTNDKMSKIITKNAMRDAIHNLHACGTGARLRCSLGVFVFDNYLWQPDPGTESMRLDSFLESMSDERVTGGTYAV